MSSDWTLYWWKHQCCAYRFNLVKKGRWQKRLVHKAGATFTIDVLQKCLSHWLWKWFDWGETSDANCANWSLRLLFFWRTLSASISRESHPVLLITVFTSGQNTAFFLKCRHTLIFFFLSHFLSVWIEDVCRSNTDLTKLNTLHLMKGENTEAVFTVCLIISAIQRIKRSKWKVPQVFISDLVSPRRSWKKTIH